MQQKPIVSRAYLNPLKTWTTNTLGTINILHKFELCKTYYIVRWNINELIQGHKMVGNPENQIKIYLNNALKDKTVCKLDLWAQVDNHYTDITNFFVLSYLNQKGNEILLSPAFKDYEENLIHDIKKYYESNPLKMAKECGH